uniref:Aspartate--tRNA(Asp/Asn) ligase n=1 Tax=Candidatus Actinomarina minuta TaxID=1389454 RepID=S5DLZ9_9ACTN|nr:aspartyl-tRNA synthetase [Candidatus Actinomarina minuta]
MNINELVNSKNDALIENLTGWVDSIRDHGGLTFVDLRDFTGTVQLVFDKSGEVDTKLKNEYYISINGLFKKRDKELVNNKIFLGDVEVEVTELKVINVSKTLPFQIEKDIDTDENIRLKYRYLDLRREPMKVNIMTRSNTFKSIRSVMNDLNIFEIDTPTLIKSTPEGAKDFLVPSRKSPSNFYALPQSPQMYKQLFMMAGFPNYYQIAKCYRDEDSRKDRQPEFTQLDLEFSDANPSLVKSNIEKIVKFVFSDAYDCKIETPFKSITYNDSMNLYGTDKPDMRITETLNDITDFFYDTEINFLKDILKNGGLIKALHTEELLTRKQIDTLDTDIKEMGSNGLGWFKIDNKEITGPLAKLLKESEKSEILKLGSGTLLFQAGDLHSIAQYLDFIRRTIFKPSFNDMYSFVWIEDFPFFEYEDGKLQPSHHPFTSPKDNETFKNDPIKAIALHYDLVLNGVELGSGSQRINNPDMQKLVLQKWGLSEEEIEERFGWFIEALSYGTPVHAGFAIGIDRLVAEVLKQPSIRDVIPFPKTQSGLDPLTNAPANIDEIVLEEYNLKYINKDE